MVHRQSEQIENFKTCQICFENYDYKNRHRCIFSTCGHVLCFTCAEHICHNLSKNCPTCRRPVSPNAIIKIFEATWRFSTTKTQLVKNISFSIYILKIEMQCFYSANAWNKFQIQTWVFSRLIRTGLFFVIRAVTTKESVLWESYI